MKSSSTKQQEDENSERTCSTGVEVLSILKKERGRTQKHVNALGETTTWTLGHLVAWSPQRWPEPAALAMNVTWICVG